MKIKAVGQEEKVVMWGKIPKATMEEFDKKRKESGFRKSEFLNLLLSYSLSKIEIQKEKK